MQTIDGILPLNKPGGVTSAKAAKHAQRLLSAEKGGHGGTLDPAAVGLLLVMLGEATKFARYLLGADKTYLARLTFGWHSDTDDGDGTLTRGTAPPTDLMARLTEILPAFIGETTQTAPTFSAIKHNGRRLYDYARKGQVTPDKPRQIRISDITLLDVSGEEATMQVRCGGGTYIRALARDMGEQLGCGCYLSFLQRSQIGTFDIKDAVSPEQLEAMPAEARPASLLAIDTIVGGLPSATLADEDIAGLGGGKKMDVRINDFSAELSEVGGTWRIYSPIGRFAGVAENREGLLRPLRFLNWTREAGADEAATNEAKI